MHAQLDENRVVVAQPCPSGSAHDAARGEARDPPARHEDAVTVVRDVRVPTPTQRLREPLARVGRLPAADQVELSVDPIQEFALATAEGAWIVGGAPPHDDVEIAAEDQIRVALEVEDAVEDRVHRADVAALAPRAVDAEDPHGPRRPAAAPELSAHDP